MGRDKGVLVVQVGTAARRCVYQVFRDEGGHGWLAAASYFFHFLNALDSPPLLLPSPRQSN